MSDDDGVALDAEVGAIRSELTNVVSQDSITKQDALTIMQLHHRFEAHVGAKIMAFRRELDRQEHALQSLGLQREINGLTLRHAADEQQLRRLQEEKNGQQTSAYSSEVARR